MEVKLQNQNKNEHLTQQISANNWIEKEEVKATKINEMA